MIPLTSIFFKEIFKLYFLFNLKKYGGDVAVLTTAWLALQVFFSSLSGYISDKNFRKQLLFITLSTSIISIIFLHYDFFWYAIIIDGIFCNSTPVARAGYCDNNPNESKTVLMTNTFIAQALPWIFICYNYKIIENYLFIIALISAIIISLLVLFIYKKHAYEQITSPSIEIKDIRKKYWNRKVIKLMVAFFLLEVIYQILPYFGEAHFNLQNLQKAFLFLGIGVTAGCLFHKFYKVINIYKSINFIILASLILFLLEFLATYFTDKKYEIPVNLYLLFSFLGGLYWPLVYSYFAEKAKKHEEGFIFGILESISSFAEVIPPIVLIWDRKEKLAYYPFIILLGIAFVLTLQKDYLSFYKSNKKKE